jgi:transposase-like protein
MRERGLDVDHSTVFRWVRAEHRRLPFSISVDKNAAYSEAFTSLQDEKILPSDCRLRRVKYLNNVIEQDHRFIKKKVASVTMLQEFSHSGANPRRH